jgi:D-sedoheptulose 7-phosphate isomerase
MTYTQQHLNEAAQVLARLDIENIEQMAQRLADVRARGGRLFFLGVGGSAGNCGHAVNDFRKLAGFEAYAPTDNVSELTARTNDEGWESSFSEWLRGSRLSDRDALLIFSVGGGSREHGISLNLVEAIDLALEVGAGIYAIVGKPDGAAAQSADVAIVIEAPAERLTPHVEGLQAVVWHGLVSHPDLATASGKWENVAEAASNAAS